MNARKNHRGYRVGQSHHNAKLTDKQVAEIRTQRQWYGTSYRELAAMYGCGESTIRDIVLYRTRPPA